MYFPDIKIVLSITLGLPWVSDGRESAYNEGDLCLIPELGRSTGGGWHGNPRQYSCLENPHGQMCLVGYSPWSCKEMDTTEQLRISIQFSSVTQSYLILCDPMKCSMPSHQILKLAQTHVHWVGDAIQPSHPLSFPSPLALILSSFRIFSNQSYS